MTVRAVLFDYSGTLFRLEEDDSWFEGMTADEREVDGHVQAELMRRLTAPTGRSVEMTPQAYHAWVNRDLAPHLHREAYLHVLRESGLADDHAIALYERVINPMSWTAYPDTAAVLKGPSPAGHQDSGGVQHRVRRAARLRGDRRGRRRRRVRAVLRGRRGQADPPRSSRPR